MPVALVENRKAALRGGVELPDESMWLPDLVDMMVQAKENGLEQYRFDPDTPKVHGGCEEWAFCLSVVAPLTATRRLIRCTPMHAGLLAKAAGCPCNPSERISHVRAPTAPLSFAHAACEPGPPSQVAGAAAAGGPGGA